MGCGQSRLQKYNKEIYLQIIDSNFLKPEYCQIRKQMETEKIYYQTFMSIDCYIEELMKKYTDNVVVDIDKYQELKQKLENIKMQQPKIYIIDKQVKLKTKAKNTSTFKDYYALIDYFLSVQQNVFIDQNTSKLNIPLKFYWNENNSSSSEQLIFKETLKKKKIHFEKYFSLQQLKKSFEQSTSDFIVTDYLYHQEIIACVSNHTRVICLCQLSDQQQYHPKTYMFSNNFLQILNEIESQFNLKHCRNVRCQKVYIYSPEYSQLDTYQEIIQYFTFTLIQFTDLNQLLNLTKFQFCATILVKEKHKKGVQKFIDKNICQFRYKIVLIPENIQPKPHKMHKLIKELKKGYKAQYSVTKSVDIIDKHYNDTKFDEIRKQLELNNIRYLGYPNLSVYIKTAKFYSPFIICNFEERNLLHRYLKQIKQKSRIIIFCNKNKITHELRLNENFSFINCHFGRIIKYIKKNRIYAPLIINEVNKNIKEKKQKINYKNQRISALNCSVRFKDSNDSIQTMNNMNFQFININQNTPLSDIREIKKQAGLFWKLQTNPIEQIDQFKDQLIVSLRQLKSIYGANYSKQNFQIFLSSLQKMYFDDLMITIRKLFSSSDLLGSRINQSLIDITKMSQKEIIHLREVLFCINLNFLSIYSMPRLGYVQLEHWTNHKLLQKCSLGSKLITKNYMIFYESHGQLENMGDKRIQTKIHYNSIQKPNIFINQFFKFKNKYIFAPYCQFIIKSITKLGNIQIYDLQLQNDVDFLNSFYTDNLFKSQNQYCLIQKQLQKPQSAMFSSSYQVDRNFHRCKAIELYHENDFQNAIKMHEQTIEIEENNQNLNSAKINQMYYQLICMYRKSSNPLKALDKIKQLFEAKPGFYIQQECKKKLQQYDLEQHDQKQYNKQSTKKILVSGQALKSFTWLKDNQNNYSSDSDEKDDNLDQSSLEQNNMQKCSIKAINCNFREIISQNQDIQKYSKTVITNNDQKNNIIDNIDSKQNINL